MQVLSSVSNSRYKYIKALSQKKNRVKYGEYTVEGAKSVRDAIASQKEIPIIAVSEEFYNGAEFSFPDSAELLVFETSIFNKLCDTLTPQGIIAVIKMSGSNAEFDLTKPYVYCDRVTDPGNLGTIIRTADAAGFGGVILSEGCVDLYSPKTVRASMGSFFNIDIFTEQNIDFLKKRIEQGFTLFGGALCHDTIDYREADFKKPSILIVGNEANGISGEVLKLCQSVKIPILGSAESLNVSVAAGILMYELVRQRS